MPTATLRHENLGGYAGPANCYELSAPLTDQTQNEYVQTCRRGHDRRLSPAFGPGWPDKPQVAHPPSASASAAVSGGWERGGIAASIPFLPSPP